MLWWNVDRKLSLVLNFKGSPLHNNSIDLIFVSETCLGIDALPHLDGYKVIADPSIKVCTHGGMAWYVKGYLSNHVSQVTFGK